MLSRICWRIPLPFIGLILVVMLGLGLYLLYYLRHIQISRLENSMYTQALVIGESLASQISYHQEASIILTLIHEWSDLLGARLTVISPTGIVNFPSMTMSLRCFAISVA